MGQMSFSGEKTEGLAEHPKQPMRKDNANRRLHILGQGSKLWHLFSKTTFFAISGRGITLLFLAHSSRRKSSSSEEEELDTASVAVPSTAKRQAPVLV